MKINHINALGTIDVQSETHYAAHTTLNPGEYPQVHDFYEYILVTRGTLLMEVNRTHLTLSESSLLLICPGDIHTKEQIGICHHINLAFPQQLIDGLSTYLDIPALSRQLAQSASQPVHLSKREMDHLRRKFKQLNLIPIENNLLKRTTLRMLVAKIITTFYLSEFCGEAPPPSQLPLWLSHGLEELNKPENFSQGSQYLAALCGKTPAHLCRIFQKYLHITPTAYINQLRLNYAANLLAHSDDPIVDIIYNAGFQSVAYFYKLFEHKYGITPSKFRK